LTSDAGQTWTTITPPGASAGTIKGVFFTDPQDGWVVSYQPPSTSNATQLQISATSDGGKSWSSSPLGKPDPAFTDSQSLPAYVDFLDAMHGWVVVMLASSANFSTGILFQTSDGGATWSRLSLPVGGPVEFISPTTGWLADGRQGDQLYVTSDGGQAWTAETVAPPAGFTQEQAAYTIPRFTSPADVILAAFSNGTGSAAGFYQANAGATSWQLKATVPAGSPSGDVSPAASLVSPTQWVAITPDGTQIVDVTQNGGSQASISPAGLPSPANTAVSQASFSSTASGWLVADTSQCAGFKTNCTERTALFATTDNGAHWTQLAVP